jgi:hypothetical protein
MLTPARSAGCALVFDPAVFAVASATVFAARLAPPVFTRSFFSTRPVSCFTAFCRCKCCWSTRCPFVAFLHRFRHDPVRPRVFSVPQHVHCVSTADVYVCFWIVRFRAAIWIVRLLRGVRSLRLRHHGNGGL